MDEGEDAAMASSMVKLDATEMLWDVADHSIQTHGGVGITEEVGLEDVLRYARALRVYEGTSESQRDTIATMMGLGD
jgi:acyl-CoA dehydrogenase